MPSSSAGARLNLHGHMPALDGVRGLAVLLVLVFHFVGTMIATNGLERAIVGVTKYGILGVDLFFVLSGFLITGILYDSRNDPHYFRNFYMRRVLRIFPLYYGVLILLFFVAPLIPMLRGATLDHLLEHQAWAWLYAVNIYIGLQGGWAFSYINHFWSLAVEEHFYLFWPLVVFSLVHRPKTLATVSLAIAICAMLARIAASFAGVNWWTTVVLTPFRLDGLALGACLAITARRPGGLERLVRALPWVAVVAALLLAATLVWTRLVSRDELELIGSMRAPLFLALLACLLIWALIAPEHSVTSRFFCSRIMVLLGTYSYGLYVYHHFISYYLTESQTELMLTAWLGSHGLAIALQALLGMLASLLLAYVSYEFYEKRFLALKGKFQASKDHAPRRQAVDDATTGHLLLLDDAKTSTASVGRDATALGRKRDTQADGLKD